MLSMRTGWQNVHVDVVVDSRVALLLQPKHDHNLREPQNGDTPLMCACQMGRVDLVKFLLQSAVYCLSSRLPASNTQWVSWLVLFFFCEFSASSEVLRTVCRQNTRSLSRFRNLQAGVEHVCHCNGHSTSRRCGFCRPDLPDFGELQTDATTDSSEESAVTHSLCYTTFFQHHFRKLWSATPSAWRTVTGWCLSA